MLTNTPVTSQDSSRTIRCLVEGESIVFSVTVENSCDVSELKELIHSERALDTKRVDSQILELWKAKIDLNGRDRHSLSQLEADHEGNEKLKSWESILRYWPEQFPDEHLHIIVKIPTAASDEMPPTEMNRTEFTMKLRDVRNWDNLCADDLSHNEVRCAKSSLYLREFQKRLRRKRYVCNAIKDWRAEFKRARVYTTSLDTHFESISPDPNLSELDCVTKHELFHYENILRSSQFWGSIYEKYKEGSVYVLLINFFGRLRMVPFSFRGFGSLLPFHLVIQHREKKENLIYSPWSDFHFCIRDFPHFLLEVNSQRNEGDRIRLLLQASCIARIGNWLRASTSGKQVVIMAVYIDKRFRAHQYLLYQPNVKSTEVEYVTKVFDLSVPETAFEFMFQLYNFLSAAKADNDGFHEPDKRLAEVKDSVVRKNFRPLSMRKHDNNDRNSDRSRSPPSRGVRDSFYSERNSDSSYYRDSPARQDIFDNPSVQREIMKAEYTLTQPISDEITLLTPIKPTMRQATSRSGVSVVLKTIVDSNERRMLQHLNDIKSPSNHTIPLLDIINLSIGKTIIVLPWKSPLDEVLRFRDCPDSVVSLCLQFIEGVACLHQHKVAHCDLKPGNVVVDLKSKAKTSPQLFIIDFDMAQSVESEETMTEGWGGTPPWIAPEIGSKDGPTQRYSPILADRWACGRMIKYFTQYFPIYEDARKRTLLTFAQRLLDVDPRARPELNQLQAIMNGPSKRKLEDTNEDEPVPKRPALDRCSEARM